MVAAQFAPRAVLDQPGGAVGALHPVPAAAAQCQRRVAAAVEEQHRLLPPVQRVADRGDQRGGQETPPRGRVFAQINRRHTRQRRPRVPVRQMQPRVPSRLHIRHRLQTGRGRDQNRGRGTQPRPHHRHVAGVVDDAILLFERGLVLLVHHDAAQIGKRQEQRRPRADDDAGLALGHRPPSGAPHAGGEVGVPHGGRHPEPPREPRQPLRGQRDLRQQDQRLAPGAQGRGDGLQIHLGLARAGDAVQQRDREGARRHRLAQRRRHGLLFRRQHGARVVRIGRLEGFLDRQGHGGQQSHLPHAADHGGADIGFRRQFQRGARLGGGEAVEHPPPRLGQAGRRIGEGGTAPAHGGATVRTEDAQRHAHHLARRGQGIGGDPVDQAAQIPPHGRGRQDGDHRAQPVIRHGGRLTRPVPRVIPRLMPCSVPWSAVRLIPWRALRFGPRLVPRVIQRLIPWSVPHHAGLLAPAQGNEDEVSGLRGEVGGHAVVERSGERIRQHHRHARHLVCGLGRAIGREQIRRNLP